MLIHDNISQEMSAININNQSIDNTKINNMTILKDLKLMDKMDGKNHLKKQ
jgi:hypothetical protein